MSTAAKASARLRIPSFRPENMSPCKRGRKEFRQVSVIPSEVLVSIVNGLKVWVVGRGHIIGEIILFNVTNAVPH